MGKDFRKILEEVAQEQNRPLKEVEKSLQKIIDFAWEVGTLKKDFPKGKPSFEEFVKKIVDKAKE